MAPSAVHRCPSCGLETEVYNSLSVFEENPHCRQCGLSVSEGDMKMQEELSSLMAQHLHLGKQPLHQPHNIPTPPPSQPDTQQAPIAYITQHYHHSSHQAPSGTGIETPPDTPATSAILAAAGIDASVLFPAQIKLFKHAPQSQQLRLIELWRLAPPTYGNQMLARDMTNWPQTSLEQEEEAARERWHRMERDKISDQRDSAIVDARNTAEPYIVRGYESLPNMNGVTAPTEYVRADGTTAYKQSSDPVYRDSREWWHLSEQQPMEHQYGMVQQMQSLMFQQNGAGQDMDEEMA